MIPLHSKLLQAGIGEFAQSRLGKKLFHDVKPYKGKYGHQVSKDFAKYRKYLGINGTGQTFHGIRHSVISKMWSAGIPEAHIAAIAGVNGNNVEDLNRISGIRRKMTSDRS